MNVSINIQYTYKNLQKELVVHRQPYILADDDVSNEEQQEPSTHVYASC